MFFSIKTPFRETPGGDKRPYDTVRLTPSVDRDNGLGSIIHELDDTTILLEGGGKAVITSMEIKEITSSWK